MAIRLREPVHDSMLARMSATTGIGALCWTLHRLTVGCQSEGDRLQILAKQIVWPTQRRVLTFGQCTFLEGEVDGPI